MLFAADNSCIDDFLKDFSPAGFFLPLLANEWITNAARKFDYSPEDTIEGFIFFLYVQQQIAGKHATPLHPSALEATVGYVSFGEQLIRLSEYVGEFEKNNKQLLQRMSAYNFSDSAIFGSVLAHEALRKVDEANKLKGIVGKFC